MTENGDLIDKYKALIIGGAITSIIAFGASWVQLNARMSVLETKIERQDEIKEEMNELSKGVNDLQRKVDILIFRGNNEEQKEIN